MSTGAASFVDAYPGCRYPAVMVGSSNGALTHPPTQPSPRGCRGCPTRSWFRSPAPMTDPMTCWRSAPRSPHHCWIRTRQIVLHHMHDPVQNALMARQMSYFRVKWTDTDPDTV